MFLTSRAHVLVKAGTDSDYNNCISEQWDFGLLAKCPFNTEAPPMDEELCAAQLLRPTCFSTLTHTFPTNAERYTCIHTLELRHNQINTDRTARVRPLPHLTNGAAERTGRKKKKKTTGGGKKRKDRKFQHHRVQQTWTPTQRELATLSSSLRLYTLSYGWKLKSRILNP